MATRNSLAESRAKRLPDTDRRLYESFRRLGMEPAAALAATQGRDTLASTAAEEELIGTWETFFKDRPPEQRRRMAEAAARRLEDEQRDQPADPEVGPPRGQERAVRAVVEDDEGPEQEAADRDREGQRCPVGDLAEGEIHQRQERHGGHDRGREGRAGRGSRTDARRGPPSRATRAGLKRSRPSMRPVRRRRSLLPGSRLPRARLRQRGD
jgi:hypothetical protein